MLIYRLTNKLNGKIYIGKTARPLRKRLVQYRTQLKAYQEGRLKSSSHIFAAIAKYGMKSFSCDVLCMCASKEELDTMEKLLIALFKSRDPEIGYNLALGGDGGAAMLGRKHTDESKALMSLAKKDKPISDFAKASRVGNSIGEKNSAAKLNWDTVRLIRAEYDQGNTSHRKLAVKYGMSASMIRNIVSGSHWKE